MTELQGVIPALRLNRGDEEISLSVKALVGLFARTWPYLRPQLFHVTTWVSARMLVEVIWLFAALVAFDLFNNKVLVGEKLQLSQVTLLFLDDSYLMGAEPGSDDDVAAGQLDQYQRKEVRDRMLILFSIAAVFLMMLAPAIDYYRTWILQRINQYLRVTMIERAEHLSLRFHSHARSGDAIYRVYQDSAMITSVVERLILEPTIAVSQVVFSFFVICLFSPVLGIMFLVGIAPIVWLVTWYTPRLQIRSRRARTTNSALTSRIQEGFAAIRIIKANRAERILSERFDTDSTSALDAAFLLRAEYAVMRVLVLTIAGLAVITAQYLTAGWTVAESPTFLAGAVALVGFSAWNLGAFQAVSSRINEFVGNGRDLIRIWGAIQDMSVGLDRAFYLLDLEPDVVDADDAMPMPGPIQQIDFEDVHFSYNADQPVLRGVNLTARAGTVTAIVGTTGSGKTTLTNLLLRLYDPDSGTVKINGVALKEIQVNSLRHGVAVALQQNTLFAATIADNITYAATNVSRDDVERAAVVACADEFIRQLPQGYDTELGERGGKLSTGQRQRLSIARAIVRDTPVLIMDEPTSALDAETEHEVLSNLSQWGQGRIVFLITHRLSTIRNADQIVFLEEGRIAETGDHETLMALPDGRYRRFVDAELVSPQVEST